jgi:hypothetical protein
MIEKVLSGSMRGNRGKVLWMSRVGLLEALVWKQRVNGLAKEPVDIGSNLSLFPTLQRSKSQK